MRVSIVTSDPGYIGRCPGIRIWVAGASATTS
jgi:hypothetical protein